jgi:hypothetical protein
VATFTVEMLWEVHGGMNGLHIQSDFLAQIYPNKFLCISFSPMDAVRSANVILLRLLITYLMSIFFPQLLSFRVSTYAARWTLMAETTKTANNTKEYEGTN